ncbi:sodium-dependent nutrient amino acid transporter 1-like isoform X2 [Culicoides brevitarsis]|uniref:sodium-dependent nutrient amino acid transporter 1-like isoform X2 n=1 Tax=Culicoides brevitarsis TaxID=469753 RepID=UPI00307C6951
MASGANNPAFVADNDNDSENSIRIIHVNPADESEMPPKSALHASKSVPSMRDSATPDLTGSTVTLTHDKSESLEEGLDMRPLPNTVSIATLSNNGDYGSRMILVDDKSAGKPVEDAPPYNVDVNGNNGNYAANITRDKPPVHFTEKDVEKKLEDEEEVDETSTGRDTWGKEIEFLLSCIAMSVGLGNVWRFPFIALNNGGGAFVIPYIIVLIIVGKPVYYLEMLIGQFSSRGSAKVYDLCPALRGVGLGQMTALGVVASLYSGTMAIILHYLYDSFWSPLPWAYCKPEWEGCINASHHAEAGDINLTNYKTSAEFYFFKEILKEKDTIHDGLGTPNWELVVCLFISWSIVAGLLIKGVKSSGKASYFLAIFPYVVLGILFTRAVTLPGAMKGLEYFFKPDWNKLMEPEVWYNAVVQVFFSLSICFGNVIMYSSYNKFRHNVSRDATIITSIDTFTSLLAGSTVFGILGHLAYKVGTDDVSVVVKSGPGLAFISYPDAIAKFDFFPQGFSVLFFFMLYTLGIGSNVAMTSCIMTIFKDKFKTVAHWKITMAIAVVMFSIAIVYTTPGGQYVLELVDYHGASFVVFFLAIVELIAFCWIYGVKRLCDDVYFMLGYRPNFIWRMCWQFITPIVMIAIFIYSIYSLKPVTYHGYVYKDSHYAIGWCLTALGLVQIPLWATVSFLKKDRKRSFMERFVEIFKPMPNWGPTNPVLLQKYKEYIAALK